MKIFKHWKRNGDIAGTFVYFKNAEGKWLWELRGRNDQTMARSANQYDNCSNAKISTEALRRFLKEECVVEQSHEPLRRAPDIPGPDIGLVELALRGTLSGRHGGPSIGMDQGQFIIYNWGNAPGESGGIEARGDTLMELIRNYRSR